MLIESKQVTEFHITTDALPKQKLVVRAHSHEKAVKKLTTELRAAIVELQKT
jgi:hypothetical protein